MSRGNYIMQSVWELHQLFFQKNIKPGLNLYLRLEILISSVASAGGFLNAWLHFFLHNYRFPGSHFIVKFSKICAQKNENAFYNPGNRY